MSSIKIFSLNTEQGKHFDKHIERIKDFDPDILCLQELVDVHVDKYKDELGFEEAIFDPICFRRIDYLKGGKEDVYFGLGLFSKYPIKDKKEYLLYGVGDELPQHIPGEQESVWYRVIVATIDKDGEEFTVATTHLPKSDQGEFTTDLQRHVLKNLLEVLSNYEDIIFCGDLNAPRGLEIFEALAEKYNDHIPKEHKTSLDLDIHRSGREHGDKLAKFMVDGIFSTIKYESCGVKLVSGMSDHMAIEACLAEKS